MSCHAGSTVNYIAASPGRIQGADYIGLENALNLGYGYGLYIYVGIYLWPETLGDREVTMDTRGRL